MKAKSTEAASARTSRSRPANACSAPKGQAIDYKDTGLLRTHISERGKIRAPAGSPATVFSTSAISRSPSRTPARLPAAVHLGDAVERTEHTDETHPYR